MSEFAQVSGSDTAPFWKAAREGRFVLPECEDCGKRHFYPRPLCPFCGSDRLAWPDADPSAEIVAWTKVHRAPFPWLAERVPYTLATARTADGPCVFGALRGVCAVHAGLAVRIGFETIEGTLPLLVFEPANLRQDPPE